MKNLFLLLLCTLLLPAVVPAQSIDTTARRVYRELSALPDTRPLLVLKTRRLLLEHLENNNLAAVDEVLRFIDVEIETDNFLALLPRERLLLYYRVGCYEEIPRYLSYIDSLSTPLHGRHLQIPDDLSNYLNTYFLHFRESQLTGIRLAGLPVEQQQMLAIWLDYLMEGLDPSLSQEDINAACNRFFLAYPDSPLLPLVRRARVEWEPIGGIHMDMGVVHRLYTGKLAGYLPPSAGLFIDMEVPYKRWRFGVNASFTVAKLRRDWIYDGTRVWPRESRSTAARVGLGAHHVQYESKHFTLSPVVSLNAFALSPSSDDQKENKSLKDAGGATFMYEIGLRGQLKLYTLTGPRGHVSHGISFRYSLLHSLLGPRRLTGLVHEFGLGYVLFSSVTRRKY